MPTMPPKTRDWLRGFGRNFEKDAAKESDASLAAVIAKLESAPTFVVSAKRQLNIYRKEQQRRAAATPDSQAGKTNGKKKSSKGV